MLERRSTRKENPAAPPRWRQMADRAPYDDALYDEQRLHGCPMIQTATRRTFRASRRHSLASPNDRRPVRRMSGAGRTVRSQGYERPRKRNCH